MFVLLTIELSVASSYALLRWHWLMSVRIEEVL